MNAPLFLALRLLSILHLQRLQQKLHLPLKLRQILPLFLK
jgi:hypothetical protein